MRALGPLLGSFMTLTVLAPKAAEAVNNQEVTSPGGITAWLVEAYTVQIVTLNVAFRGGGAHDPDGNGWRANLISVLLA